MQPASQITSVWKDTAVAKQYRTGVSLHVGLPPVGSHCYGGDCEYNGPSTALSVPNLFH